MIETQALRMACSQQPPLKRTCGNESPPPEPRPVAPFDFFDPNIDQPEEALKLPIMQPEVQLMLGGALLSSMMGGAPFAATAMVDVQTGERHSNFNYNLTNMDQVVVSGGGLVDDSAHTSTRATLAQDNFLIHWKDNFRPKGSELFFEAAEEGFTVSGQVGEVEVDLSLKMSGPMSMQTEGTLGGLDYSVSTQFMPREADDNGMSGVVKTEGHLGDERIERDGTMSQDRQGSDFDVSGQIGDTSQRIQAELKVKE